MSVVKLENLPSELWLELFVYFSWSELNSTWITWRLNSRIQTLALMAQSRVALKLTSMSLKSWGEWLDYFENEHSTIAHRITSLVLDEPILSCEITERWLEQGSSFFPRIRRCIIYDHLIKGVALSNLIRLIHEGKSTLHHLIIFFNRPDSYRYVLKQILDHRISLHSMQLIIVEDGKHFFTDYGFQEMFFRYPPPLPAFPRTVSLRLSLRRVTELTLFTQRGTLPHVRHLHITLEESFRDRDPWTGRAKESPTLKLSPDDFHRNRSDLPNLRSFHLQQILMSDIIVLIEHFSSMGRLESLTVVKSNVKDKKELLTFKSSIRTRLHSLRQLTFILNLPGETMLEKDDLHWFNLGHRDVQYEIDSGMLLYTLPYLLNSHRQLHNHTFARRSQLPSQIEHLEWIVDDDSLSIKSSLVHLQYIHSLTWFYIVQEVDPRPDPWSLLLPLLRYVELDFQDNPLASHQSPTPMSHRTRILELIRATAPSLQCLTLSWDSISLLGESLSPWPCLLQLDICLSTTEQDDPAAYVLGNVIRSEVFPQLRYLSFSRRRFRLSPPEQMVERILAWLDALILSLPKLATFHVNRRCGYYRSRPRSSLQTCITLLKQHPRFSDQHYPITRVIINCNEEIVISL